MKNKLHEYTYSVVKTLGGSITIKAHNQEEVNEILLLKKISNYDVERDSNNEDMGLEEWEVMELLEVNGVDVSLLDGVK